MMDRRRARGMRNAAAKNWRYSSTVRSSDAQKVRHVAQHPPDLVSVGRTSSLSTRACPESGRSRHARIFMVVDLPAPLDR